MCSLPLLGDGSLLTSGWALLCWLPIMGWQERARKSLADTQLTTYCGEVCTQRIKLILCCRPSPTHSFNIFVKHL